MKTKWPAEIRNGNKNPVIREKIRIFFLGKKICFSETKQVETVLERIINEGGEVK